MQLVNIYNSGYDNEVFLFTRDNNGQMHITTDNSYDPYYYEVSKTGIYTSYDGKSLRKMNVHTPNDVSKACKGSMGSTYYSDLPFVKKYMIERVDKITKTTPKYCMIDIEIYCTAGLPTPDNPHDVISCISVYNSVNKQTRTFWIKDYNLKSTKKKDLEFAEAPLLNDFIQYMRAEQFDLWLSWNVDFDYGYLFNRLKKKHGRNLAKEISPIGRTSYNKKIEYPAGMSVLDYLLLFKKVFMREASYKLDYVAQKHLDEDPWAETDFGTLDQIIRDKNVNDVVRMAKLEEKFNLLEYFDEIRLLCTCLWGDLYYNSFLIETILLRLAHERGVILPNSNRNMVESTFQGASREAKKTGVLKDIGKFDLSSAYPSMIVNFCLDPVNILDDGADRTNAIEIDGLYVKQDENALCPTMVKKLMELKDNRKAELGAYTPETPEHKKAKRKYDAIKGVVNSAFGVFGLSNFRLFDNRVASRIAGLARELLTYARKEIQSQGFDVVYWDTDSLFLNWKGDISDILNDLVQQWGKVKYGKDSIDIDFTYEGYYPKIFILTKCRYIGDLVTSKGIESEVKGLEMKRASSTQFEKAFQKELFKRILDDQTEKEITGWILEQRKIIKEKPFKEIAFPCKLSNKEYANIPIFVRALEYTNIFKKMKVETGEIFYWIYILPENVFNKKGYILLDVLAFKTDKDICFTHNKVDWDKMIQRNITSKAEAIFTAMGWSTFKITNPEQQTLF